MKNMNSAMTILKYSFGLCLLFALLHPMNILADDIAGEEIYLKRCVGCHGIDGDGLGPAEERLNPPPRDFTSGMFKFKSTGFDDMIPNDRDLVRMITDGMPGTAMPGWDDVLSEQDIVDLVSYLKTFSGFEEEEPSQQVDYGEQVASDADSIAKGKLLFHESDRCSECHGEDGKGDAIKRLKGDNGERTWPRNLTKPWTFRTSNDPKDIFTRISVGTPGTQMPSFADPISKKKLSIEQRWHVANYVSSLAKTVKVVRAENTVVIAEQIDQAFPATADDPSWDALWARSKASTFMLVPNIITQERFFTPSNDTITAKALYNDTEIAILLEWDDRTKSVPGDDRAEKISEPNLSPDGVAIQFPVDIPKGMEKPFFIMGDSSHPVILWKWNGPTNDEPADHELITAKGVEEINIVEANFNAVGRYKDGTWQVLFTRLLKTAESEEDIQFEPGQYIPLSFAAWDGSNGERDSKHTLTPWYWLLLAPKADSTPAMAGGFAAFSIFLILLWWFRTKQKALSLADDE